MAQADMARCRGGCPLSEQSGPRGSNRFVDTQTRFAKRATKATPRSGAPEEIRTPDPQIRSYVLHRLPSP
jgi:hypothetical protein